MSKLFDKLCDRIESELGCKVISDSFHRTRAGHWQRSMGAWSWSVDTTSGLVGSAVAAHICLSSPKWEIVNYRSDAEICPFLTKEGTSNE